MGALAPNRQERLGELTLAVSYAVGAHAQCITGVALLVQLAKLYKIELSPRAVSMAGQSPLGALATGTAAKEFIISHGGLPQVYKVVRGEDPSWPEDAPFRRSGHMVAIDEWSSHLLDPSFEQFVPGGFPNVVIMTPIDPTEAEWAIQLSDDSFIVYLPGADVGGWRSPYERALLAVARMANEIYAHLQSGGAPNTHTVRLDLDGAILV